MGRRLLLILLCALLTAEGSARGRGRRGGGQDAAVWQPHQHDDCREFGASHIEGFVVSEHRFTPRWIGRTLHGVIADHCRSKTYQDLHALDGGTVGISHFASGSLRNLYREMDAVKYFGAHAHDIPKRPFQHAWWRAGMRRFLHSPEARAVQQRAWRTYITPALAQALAHGWSGDRELAIAAGVANSLGAIGFVRVARRYYWSPEQTLAAYAKLTDHKYRRRLRINREFPKESERKVAVSADR